MERIIHFCFLLAALIVVGMGVLLYDSLSQGHGVTVRLHQVNKIFDVVHRIRDNYIDAEKAAYKYAASDNPADHAESALRLNEVNADIVALGALLHRNAGQAPRLRQLTAAFAKLDPMLRASQIAGQVDTAAALAIQRRQDFFDVVSEISNSTLRDFGHFDETTRDHFRATLVKLASLVAIGLLILVAVYLHILWQFRVHKRLEAQQKESDELLRLAVDSVDGMIIYVDRNRRYKFCNKAYSQYAGHDREAMVGATMQQMLDKEVYRQIEPYLDRVLAGQEVRLEHPLLADGSFMEVRACLIPHFDGKGQVQGFFGQFTDITEYRRKEALLLEKTSFQRAILDSARISIITTDREGIIRSFNVGAEHMLGYRAGELVGKVSPACFHEEQECRQRARTLSIELGKPVEPGIDVLIAKARRGHVDEQEWTYIRKDGTRIPVFLSITALRSKQDEIIGYLGIAFDITQQKQTEAQLVQARIGAESATRAKSAFLATISHEIRTPMNGVLGMAEVLACSPLTQHQTEIVQTVRESAGVLLSLIDDILDFSKIEAGRLELEEAPLSIRDLAEGLCTSLLPVAASKGVDLRLFVSPDIPEQVLADDVRLRQVLYNLLGNAIKFSGARPMQRGQVRLRVDVAQAAPLSIVFRIIDNGIGIAPEAMKGLFSAFTQAEASTTRRFGGTGLGLAICKRIVELAQGTIHVESTLDVGSTFIVTLPFTQAPTSSPPDLPDLTGLDCIVVDHLHIDAADLRAYLVPQGARVQIVADLETAAKIVAKMVAAAPVVVVHDAGGRRPLPPILQAAPKDVFNDVPHVRHLLFTRGGQRQARIQAPDTVSLSVDALSRYGFLHAVAVAAGRASPEQMRNTARVESAPLTQQRPSIAEARAQSRLILVAEDDAINQKVILHQLSALGYAAEFAGTGTEALRMWRAGRYALLLTDLHMPGLDGYGLATAIRAEESPARRVPILALTANALRGESGRAMSCGMDGYLTKPVRLDVLRKALEKWMPQDGTAWAGAAATAGAVAIPDAAAVDVNVLKALVGGDEATVHELLAEFQAMSWQEAAALHRAFDAGDIALTGSIAHKLKSSSRSVGALGLGEACAKLENAGKAGDKDAVRVGMQQFDVALAAVDNALNGLLVK